MSLSSFVKEYENSLSSKLCREMIKRFELDSKKRPGKIADGYNPKVKKSIDLDIALYPEWSDVTNILKREIIKCAKDYTSYLKKTLYSNCINDENENDLFSFFNAVRINNFNIQKTEEGGGFIWHHDESRELKRIFVYMWYLNTVDPECGGSTDILNDISIQPVEGKLVIFPASWLFIHRGRLLKSGVKYICTGWITV
jgi:hypothetical protein